jgi:hypothetical protein
MIASGGIAWARVLVASMILVSGSVTAWSGQSGKFVGKIVASFLPDGRNLRLEAPFAYIDSSGTRWDVPSGVETDGASIPKAFWLAYPPFTGRYREAAVVHDYYCQTQERPWRDTHNVFYDAMLTSGVDDTTAKAMWAAVYYMGPRWGFGEESRGPGAVDLPDEQKQIEFMKRLEVWITENNPSREELQAVLDKGQLPR